MSARILVVLHEERDGGATRAVRRVVPLLEERGFGLEFWAPRPSPLADELEGEGRTVHGAPRLLRYSRAALREPPGTVRRLASVPAYLRRLREVASTGSYDLVHLNTLLTMPEARAVRRAGIPALVHAHEMLPAGARGRATARFLRANTAGAVTVSEAAARPLRRQRLRTTVVPNGVELPAPSPRADHDPIRVGAIGTVSHRKGSDLVLALGQALRERGQAVEIRMIGPLAPGPENAWAKNITERAAAAGVNYTGPEPPEETLPELDAVVTPSREDPFPLVVLEAMAAGLPVIGAAVDGIPEQLGENAGVLVPPEDVGAMAQAVVDLAGDPERRHAIGAAARERVADHFTLERQADGLASAYRAAITA